MPMRLCRLASAGVFGCLLILTLSGREPWGPVAAAEGPPAESATATATATPAELVKDARRIVVLGDSITYGGRWVALFTAWLESRGCTAEVIDMGLSSETVSGLSEPNHAGGTFPRPDLHERLDRVLRIARPDLVIACYGMNCGIYLPLEDDRFGRYRTGIERLHDAAVQAGANIIHLTPPVYDQRPDRPGPAGETDYDAVLTAYTEWLLSRRSDGWHVIDIHGPMKSMLKASREQDPQAVFAPDAVHPNEVGSWAICRALLDGFNVTPDGWSPEMASAFLPEVTQRMEILRDAYLSAAGHLRPGVKQGLPLDEAITRANRISDSIRSRRLQLRGGHRGTQEWRMPIDWPRPPVVHPGPAAAEPATIPADAVVLFDGSDLSAWQGGELWKVADGLATVGKGTIATKQGFGDCHLHLEFRTVKPATGKGQGRSNSGVFLMGKYEIQILDSFEDGTDGPVTYPDGQCGAVYKQQPPAVNACREPGEWQTFDILFTRPRFAGDGSLASPGRISLLHNGIAVHIDTVIKGATHWHAPPAYEPHADALPITLQDHGNPVQFRSIWVRPFESTTPGELDAIP
jgi:lysophospholipase L1-like esterase